MTRGSRHAKLVVVEFSEFQCSYCGQFAREVLPALDQAYVASGKVLWAFRHFPLESIHPYAVKAAESAECAGVQGKFWEMRDLLFQNQKQLDEPSLVSHAHTLSLDEGQFKACMRGDATERVREDVLAGRALGITGTPSFVIGYLLDDGRVQVARNIAGVGTVAQFKKVVDGLLAAGPPKPGRP